jgi:hypothetical protein
VEIGAGVRSSSACASNCVNGPEHGLSSAATLSCSIYVYGHPVLQPKYFMRMINFKFSMPRYLTNNHVIPQFCGIYQS